MSVKKEQLRRFSFLRPLSDHDLAELAPRVERRSFPANSLIFADGTAGDMFYLLDSGQVEIFKPTSDGEIRINLLNPPDVFGEMSLLDEQPRSAAARAATDVSLIAIPKPVFLDLVRREPSLLFETISSGYERLRRSDLERLRELEANNRQLHELYKTSLDITRHLELPTVLAAIVERATQLLNSSSGTLWLHDHTRNLLIPQPTSPLRAASVPAGRALVSTEARAAPLRPGEGCTGAAFTRGEPVIENRTRRSRSHPLPLELAVPVRLNQQMLGALTVFRPLDAAEFTSGDAQLLELFANQAAIAIENARLYALAVEKGRLDGELNTARQVQRSLIPPRAPRVRGYQLAGLWRPAREVSGDFYDFIPLPDRKWGLVIADVSDKGMPAALFMASARSILRASASAAVTTAGVIQRANHAISLDATRGMFVTLFYAALDSAAHRLTYVNGGHNPPLWWRARLNRVEYLAGRYIALGILPDQQFEARDIELEPDDVLVLYTDGVTEAMTPNGDFFGEERFRQIVQANAGEEAVRLVQAIDEAIRTFTGDHALSDDVTVVVVRRR